MYSQATKSRRGVTLLEVLFSVLIGAIGLLGAIALLPVASEQARKGRQADATAIAGESFVNDLIVRRLFDPDHWIARDGGGSYILHHQNAWYASGATSPTTNGPSVGQSFCIDPRGFSLHSTVANYQYFPYGTGTGPWMHRVGIPDRAQPSSTSPNRRGYLYQPCVQSMADLVATCSDDLVAERSTSDRALPARQSYNPSAPTSFDKLIRESEGRVSWIATLCPNIGNIGDEYILSVVCFYNRPLPIGGPDTSAEREITQIALPGGGITGGEITLGNATESNLELHTGDWIMLKGPRSPSTNIPARYRWYRVLDTEVQARLVSGTYVREATLFGPDWALPEDETQAVLLTGVTAVYERTVRIQRSSLWP